MAPIRRVGPRATVLAGRAAVVGCPSAGRGGVSLRHSPPWHGRGSRPPAAPGCGTSTGPSTCAARPAGHWCGDLPADVAVPLRAGLRSM
eukprot:8705521-Alexandrium_andersonii.AAC.1